MDIAAAAVQLAHKAGAGAAGEEVELPAEPAPAPRKRARSTPPAGVRAIARPGHPGRERRGSKPASGMARLFVGAGRLAKMRPADLVGAITNEAGIEGRSIGAIEIAERHSLVELPEELIDEVIAALRATTIKGKRQTIRRDKANRPSRA
jgi:ATP-dependent RNA helicase DeaD